MANIREHNEQNARIPELDGVRGLAILMVVVWHYVGCQLQSGDLLSGILLFATKMLWSGVDLFFVLSGFLIGGILLRNRGSANYFKTFYIRRVVRIFPLYYLLFLLYLIFLFFDAAPRFPWLTNNLMPLWSYATFTQNYFMGVLNTYGGNWFAITWSLAIEEQFYLLLPLTLFFISDKKVIPALIAVIVITPLIRFWTHDFHSSVSLFCRMDSFLVGVLVAHISNNKIYDVQITSNKKKIYFIFYFLLLGFAVMHFKGFGPVKSSWLSLLYGFFILIVVYFKEDGLARFTRNKFLAQLGMISYGVYVFHQLISGLLHQVILNNVPQLTNMNELMVTLLSFLFTIAVSVLSFRFYETPLLRIGQRYKY